MCPTHPNADPPGAGILDTVEVLPLAAVQVLSTSRPPPHNALCSLSDFIAAAEWGRGRCLAASGGNAGRPDRLRCGRPAGPGVR